jgi:CpXC motif protein
MSTWTERIVTCPCGNTQTMRVALGIHVTRAPAVRDDILARRLHRATCTCGKRLHVAARFEYTDLDRKQFVLVRGSDEIAAWPAHEVELRATMRQAFELGAPMVSELVRSIRGRVVFGQEQLREKLVVWAAGLDDALVECVKLEAFALDPTLAAPGSGIVVDEVATDRLACVWFDDMAGGHAARRIDIPMTWFERAERDHTSFAARFPALFGDGFVSVQRMLVA